MKNHILRAITNVIIFSLLILGATVFFVYQEKWIGIIFIILGILHVIVLEFFKIKLKTIWPDIIFGMIDNGLFAIGAIIGADLAGILGAIIGGSAVNTITDGLAGLFEGYTAEHLRNKKIKEQRTTLGSALGKMAGCLFGAGLVFLIAWGLFN